MVKEHGNGFLRISVNDERFEVSICSNPKSIKNGQQL